MSAEWDALLKAKKRIWLLEGVLLDMLAEKSGQPKSCGHSWECVCPSQAAITALATKKGA